MIEIIQSGVPIARCEFLDTTSMNAINRHFKTNYPERMTLFLEFQGSAASVAEQAEQVQGIAREHGGSDFEWETRPEARNRLWHARHNLYFAGLQLKPGARYVSTDVCVPISRLSDCLVETEKDVRAASMPIIVVGHVGDGNMHFNVSVPVGGDPTEFLSLAPHIHDAVYDIVRRHRGSISAEHGIGRLKRDALSPGSRRRRPGA